MKLFIKLFFRTLRLILAPALLLVNGLTTPKGMVRPPEVQAEVDAATRRLTLFQFRSCPFCIKTRRAMKRLSLNIETKDALHDAESRQALLEGGGEIKVPCLRITEADGAVRWMYESDDIIAYLTERFGASA